MRRLLAATMITAAFAVPTAAAHADHYWRDCGGVVDLECSGRVCPTDCWTRDCLVWVDLFHDSNTAQCVGPVVK
ncbi:MAG TPA: hypothetical protein VNQ77_20145 [Frankiaceae bacterium]|nr:hypothetical protein [Frankiaceae bacterium]